MLSYFNGMKVTDIVNRLNARMAREAAIDKIRGPLWELMHNPNLTEEKQQFLSILNSAVGGNFIKYVQVPGTTPDSTRFAVFLANHQI